MYISIAIYLALIASFFALSSYLERTAAMRGTHRRRMPRGTDIAIRLFFLLILTYPLMIAFPYVCIPLVLLYAPTFVDNSEKTGARASTWFKGMPLFRFVKWYFHLSIAAKEENKLDPNKQYIIGIHPHGFLPVGTMVNLLSSVTDADRLFLNGVRVRALVASFCFYMPIYRDLLLSGGIIDAARYNAKNALTKNKVSLVLVPGGATEALYAHPGVHKLVLRRRRGFIRLAIETGAHLVPCYSFGETDCYDQMSSVFPFVEHIQTRFQRIFGLSLPIVTNIIPRRSHITTVVGKAIEVQQKDEPTDEEISQLLELYMERLTELFNEHAPTYIENPEHRKLEII